MPCSPNKLMVSNVSTIRPGKRLLPTGFQTVARTRGVKALGELDDLVDSLVGGKSGPVLIPVEDGVRLLELAYQNLEFEEDLDDERRAHVAALEHLSRIAGDRSVRNMVWLLVAKDRKVARYREEGRFSNAPDTKQQADLAAEKATDIPVLMMLRQQGDEALGWRGLAFWWPVIVTPKNSVTSIFSAETDDGDSQDTDIPDDQGGVS